MKIEILDTYGSNNNGFGIKFYGNECFDTKQAELLDDNKFNLEMHNENKINIEFLEC